MDNNNSDQSSHENELFKNMKFISIDELSPKHFEFRKSHSDYKRMKELEDKLDALTKVHENINVYFFYVGLLYGERQRILEPVFDAAFK